MCGIVGAIAQRPVAPILIEGLRRLEYRGYDSAGLLVIEEPGIFHMERALGKVAALTDAIKGKPFGGKTGIAHTRWATHGVPAVRNCHPQVSHERCAVVHNGIVENHEELRQELLADGFSFASETDTEVIAHLIYRYLQAGKGLMGAVERVKPRLQGAYALAVLDLQDPNHLVVINNGAPMVIGLGFEENFVASDVRALLPVTNRFIFLQPGDIAELTLDQIRIFDGEGQRIQRSVKVSEMTAEASERGNYRHFMHKEIHEQPDAIDATIDGCILQNGLHPELFGMGSDAILKEIRQVTIVACGTSFHAGLVAREWIESIAGIPCVVDIASEYRFRTHLVQDNALFVSISQSGETADTLAALRQAKLCGYSTTLAICNALESALERESDFCFHTNAGPEVGVASTKAFTTQLVALYLLALRLATLQRPEHIDEVSHVTRLRALSSQVRQVLLLEPQITQLAERFIDKAHTLFLGRGEQYPIALEGALKLKELSYIHAEAYPAGELKHGPLALIDDEMPVIAVAPNNALAEKLKANIEEVRTRGGQLFIFADDALPFSDQESLTIIRMPKMENSIEPVLFTIPLQLLAYHVAVLKGTDVDQPRNLAKSVTVE